MVGDDGGKERSLLSGILPNTLLRVVGGVSGGTGAEFTQRLCFPNAQIRVVGGV